MTTVRAYAARKLKEIRQERKLSANTVGAAIGVHPTTILRMEGTKHRLDTELLVKICKYYNVALDFVVGTYSDEVEAVPTELATVAA